MAKITNFEVKTVYGDVNAEDKRIVIEVLCNGTDTSIAILQAVENIVGRARDEVTPEPQAATPPKEEAKAYRFVVRTTGTHEVASLETELDAAKKKCVPGSEVYDTAEQQAVYVVPIPKPVTMIKTVEKLGKAIEKAGAAISTKLVVSTDLRESGSPDGIVEAFKKAVEKSAATKLSEVAEINNTPALKVVAPRKLYKKGSVYDGVKVLKAQRNPAEGFTVLTLVDGTLVQLKTSTNAEIGRKNSPPAPEGADTKNVEVIPTTRQTGLLAPAEDKELADTNGTPVAKTPVWLANVIAAKTINDAVTIARKRIPDDGLVEWAQSVYSQVPTFTKINEKSFEARITRFLLASPAGAN